MILLAATFGVVFPSVWTEIHDQSSFITGKNIFVGLDLSGVYSASLELIVFVAF